MPLLAPLLEPVRLRAALQGTWNLFSCRRAIQYSTPTETTPAGRGYDPSAVRQQDQRDLPASALRAGERDATHCGTRRNRISSTASGGGAGSTHSSRDESREFFRNPPPCDGPRSPPAAPAPHVAAGEPAADNGTIARDDAPCLAPPTDIAALLAAATRPARLPRRLCRSIAKEDARERTISRIL